MYQSSGPYGSMPAVSSSSVPAPPAALRHLRHSHPFRPVTCMGASFFCSFCGHPFCLVLKESQKGKPPIWSHIGACESVFGEKDSFFSKEPSTNAAVGGLAFLSRLVLVALLGNPI